MNRNSHANQRGLNNIKRIQVSEKAPNPMQHMHSRGMLLRGPSMALFNVPAPMPQACSRAVIYCQIMSRIRTEAGLHTAREPNALGMT